MIAQNLMLVLVLLPFVGALAAVTQPRGAQRGPAWISGATMAAGLVILAALRGPAGATWPLRASLHWAPSAGLDLAFRLDGFAWLFAALILGIGILVVLYARYYLAPTDSAPRFHALLLAFCGSMLGLVLSANVIILVVFWEMTSLLSFLLIGFRSANVGAREGARMSLIVTAGGGLCLLVAMLILGRITGSYDLDHILAAGAVIRAHPLYPPLLVLFLLGAFTKSAQMPFHFWLPGAMAAPTPVSAYLHSATMVKAGVFLLIRFSPALGGTDAWFWMVTGTGMLTMTLGAVIALFRHDLKGLLAYSTVSHLGLITALAGLGSETAILAAIFHIVNHAVFKASLFMAAGIIDHETGTRDMRRLSGLIHFMPVTGALAIVASAAMAGVPLLNGFISKEMFFAAAADWHNGTWLDNALPLIATVGAAFSVAYSARFIATVFFGPPATDLPHLPHEPVRWMRRPVEALVFICLAIGIAPDAVLGPTLNAAARGVLGPLIPHVSISPWHGLNLPLMMSVIALLAGAAIYFPFARRISEGPEGPPLLWRVRAVRLFEIGLLAVTWKWPRVLHRAAGTDRLQPQILVLVCLALLAGLGVTFGRLSPIGQRAMLAPDLAFVLMWIAGGAAAVGAAALAKYHRFAALMLLGVAGAVTCLTFAWASAPDLAVTQLLVEVVTTVLLLLGLRWLPKRNAEIPGDRLFPARLRRARDLVIAIIAGAATTMAALAVMTRPPGPSIGNWFLRNAHSEAGGLNAVNVILVDFRAFDTFGEITVLGVVGLTVFALLRRFRPADESAGRPAQQTGKAGEIDDLPMLVPSITIRWMFPVLIVFSAWLFMRGHDLPGGGFSAGVTLAIALLAQYLGADTRWIEARITVLPIRWIGVGLLIAGLTGMSAAAFGYPFLSAQARYVELPGIGAVPASTAMAFDLGVYALVVGATVLMLIAIAHQSLRSARQRERAAEEEGEAA
ncbi:MAG: monovalent cation/H+ antiporter subunit A [Rubellimicrobium sp.]|nr:monovalent cation/H+ antiporter subunit A [Rubellimicrobium sp.]